MRVRIGKPQVQLAPPPKKPRWWLGVAVLVLAVGGGVVLAAAVQLAIGADFGDFTTVLHWVFLALGIVGMLAGSWAEGPAHGATFELHHHGIMVSTVVNAVLYAALMVLWARIPRKPRLKT